MDTGIGSHSDDETSSGDNQFEIADGRSVDEICKALRDHGDHSYFGAAPPAGDRPHRYVFSVHALDIPTLGCDDDTSLAMYSFEALEHTIARATLTVTYQTPSN